MALQSLTMILQSVKLVEGERETVLRGEREGSRLKFHLWNRRSRESERVEGEEELEGERGVQWWARGEV